MPSLEALPISLVSQIFEIVCGPGDFDVHWPIASTLRLIAKRYVEPVRRRRAARARVAPCAQLC